MLTRDGDRCRLALPGCTTIANQVHHTVARELVGDDPAYLLAACQHCNNTAGDPRERTDPAPRPRTQW